MSSFYQKEAGIVADLDETDGENHDEIESEGNLLNPSNEQSQMTPSTGETSTIDSSGSEFETSGSTIKTLETSQAG